MGTKGGKGIIPEPATSEHQHELQPHRPILQQFSMLTAGWESVTNCLLLHKLLQAYQLVEDNW